jgi:predicted lactoylglutathione lyase
LSPHLLCIFRRIQVFIAFAKDRFNNFLNNNQSNAIKDVINALCVGSANPADFFVEKPSDKENAVKI